MNHIKWDGGEMTKWELTLKSIPLQLMMIAPLPISSTLPHPPPPPPQVFQLKKAKLEE